MEVPHLSGEAQRRRRNLPTLQAAREKENKMSALGDNIITMGPFLVGQSNPLAYSLTKAQDMNDLRNELIVLREIKEQVDNALCVSCLHSRENHNAENRTCAGAGGACKCDGWCPYFAAFRLKRREGTEWVGQ
jgi:hypothetical protein